MDNYKYATRPDGIKNGELFSVFFGEQWGGDSRRERDVYIYLYIQELNLDNEPQELIGYSNGEKILPGAKLILLTSSNVITETRYWSFINAGIMNLSTVRLESTV